MWCQVMVSNHLRCALQAHALPFELTWHVARRTPGLGPLWLSLLRVHLVHHTVRDLSVWPHTAILVSLFWDGSLTAAVVAHETCVRSWYGRTIACCDHNAGPQPAGHILSIQALCG